MTKQKTTILVLLPIVACLFALLFTYLALLGENDRISTVVEDLFTNIRKHNYPQTLEYLSRDLRNDIGSDVEQFYETCFLLELSLLKQYELLNEDNYRLEFRKEHLWMPYLQDKTIPVGVSLQKNEPKKLSELLGRDKKMIFVDNLFSLIRENGSWKIERIDYTGSTLADTFSILKEEVELDQYLQKMPEGFRVSSFTVKTEGMTPVEKRRISFIIHKVLRYLGEYAGNKSDDGGMFLY